MAETAVTFPTQAGEDILFAAPAPTLFSPFPEAMTTLIPLLIAFCISSARGSLLHSSEYNPAPRLMLITLILYSSFFCTQ